MLQIIYIMVTGQNDVNLIIYERVLYSCR